MNQVFIGIIIVLGLGSYWLYSENTTLKANNAALEGAVEEQKLAMESIQKDFTLQTEQLNEMTIKKSSSTERVE